MSDQQDPLPVSPDGPAVGINIPLSVEQLLERVQTLETWRAGVEARFDELAGGQ
jgi:hypothetical protein